jgi:hypothetical protein
MKGRKKERNDGRKVGKKYVWKVWRKWWDLNGDMQSA